MPKTCPYHTRTPCQEGPEGPKPWTRPVLNVAFWLEENKVQNGIPKMPKNAPLPHQNTVPGGARRLPTMDAATPEWHPQDAKKRAPTTPERRARRCPKAPNHGHGRCLTLLSDLKKTRSRNGILKMLKNAPLPHPRPRTMDTAGA